MGKKRRGSRLFSGQPGLLLVSEDIPGIMMPAPPAVADLPPLEEEDDVFDIDALHAEEDAEESAGHEGPLRVFLGAPGGDAESAVDSPAEPAVEAEDDGPIWDVSALAMPEAPSESDEALDFLDEAHDVSDDDVVPLESTPPPLVMKVSLEDDAGLSPGDWADDDGPTVPAMPAPSMPAPTIADSPPVHVAAQGDPLDVPDRTPFQEDTDESPTRVETMVNEALGDAGLRESEWNEDEETFFGDAEGVPRSVPSTPPKLSVDPDRASRDFRPIPDKADPPVIPILAALIGIVVIAVVIVGKFGSDPAPQPGTLENTVKVRPPVSNKAAPAPKPAAAAAPAPVGDVGFLTIESDKEAIIYVGDKKVGTTPLRRVEVTPGNHRVLALEIDGGVRKSATQVVVRGQERRIVFQFR